MRSAFSNVNSGKSIIRLNYILKIVGTTGACIAVSLFAILLRNNYSGFNTERVINEYFSEYYYADFVNSKIQGEYNGEVTDSVKDIVYQIYDEQFDLCKPIMLRSNRLTDDDYPKVNANVYAFEYLSSVIEPLSELSGKQGLWVVFPDEFN